MGTEIQPTALSGGLSAVGPSGLASAHEGMSLPPSEVHVTREAAHLPKRTAAEGGVWSPRRASVTDGFEVENDAEEVPCSS